MQNSFYLWQEDKKLRGNKRYTTLDTRKDGVRFSNSSLRQLNDQFQSLRETYDDVQSKLANEVIKIASKCWPLNFLLFSRGVAEMQFHFLSVSH